MALHALRFKTHLRLFKWVTVILLLVSDSAYNYTMDEKEFERAYPSILDIYPEVEADRTRVTWAHGVDSRRRLQRALRSKSTTQ